jgi:SAM-dependent methyltransferase
VATDIAAAWERFSGEYQEMASLPTASAHYGPDVPGEDELRLLGDIKGKRVLELGCGAAQCSIAFAKAGAIAIGVDFSSSQLALARRLCEQEDVRIELRHTDMADLAFLRADSIDVAFSSYAFQYVEDLSRVFRQVHRVLKVGAPLVFSLPHPAWAMIDESSIDGDSGDGDSGDGDSGDGDSGGMVVGRSYFDRTPIETEWAGVSWTTYPHTFSSLYTNLSRASYRVEVFAEPEPKPAPHGPFWHPAMELVPRTLIVRARKEGS